MTTTTATVEVLRAEVRVIRMGGKQITSGIYWQLDRIDAENIEPFGRVRPSDSSWEIVYVIGADPDGVLSRSSARVETDKQSYDKWGELPLIVLTGLR